MKITTATKVLELINPIAEEDFITDHFSDIKSKCCVIGHVKRLTSEDPNDYSNENCFSTICDPYHNLPREIRIQSLIFISDGLGSDISVINNQKMYSYTQDTPKQRVVALLNDMIAAGL